MKVAILDPKGEPIGTIEGESLIFARRIKRNSPKGLQETELETDPGMVKMPIPGVDPTSVGYYHKGAVFVAFVGPGYTFKECPTHEETQAQAQESPQGGETCATTPKP